ncbi:hypothetical protein ACLOJK_000083 [Asimina triloba]
MQIDGDPWPGDGRRPGGDEQWQIQICPWSDPSSSPSSPAACGELQPGMTADPSEHGGRKADPGGGVDPLNSGDDGRQPPTSRSGERTATPSFFPGGDGWLDPSKTHLHRTIQHTSAQPTEFILAIKHTASTGIIHAYKMDEPH